MATTGTRNFPTNRPGHGARQVARKPAPAGVREPAQPQAFRWTAHQYHQLGEAGFFQDRRVELIEGSIVQMAPMNEDHRESIIIIPLVLQTLFGFDFAIGTQISLPLGAESEPQPDIQVFRRPASGRLLSANAIHDAVLVVEISESSLRYDRKVKAALYAGAGVTEYWIVNLLKRELEVMHAPVAGRYTSTQVLKADETVSPLAAPGARITVSELLP